MKKVLATFLVVFSPSFVHAQMIQNIGAQAVAPANDFATRAFQDPWDMNERTDLGWWVNGVDAPTPGFNEPVSFSGGVFTGVTNTTDPSFFLLESGNPNAAKLGKIGLNYPIDANVYKIIAFRMSVTTSGSAVQFYWNRQTIYDGTTTQAGTGGTTGTTAGYRIYMFDLSTLPTQNLGNSFAWGGLVRALRMDPTLLSGQTVMLDWVRLVPAGNASLCRTITWSGAATVDLYLTDSSNNSLGKIAAGVSANQFSPGCAANAAGYTYYAGALPPGTYKVGVSAPGLSAPTDVGTASWVVNDTPTLEFTSPDPEGGADFASTVLGNAWDMNATTDFDGTANIQSPAISSIPLETPAGASLGAQPVYTANSVATTGIGDPYLRAFCGINLVCTNRRGQTNRIDTRKYRILTFEMGLQNKARDILHGSIARVVWRVAGEAGENVSDDIIINSRAGANVVDKIMVDMADRNALPLEPGTAQSGWVQGTSGSKGVDAFRVDPHEFSPATPFFIKRIKLAALETANTSYTIQWDYSDASGAGTVDLYYSPTVLSACANGTLIDNAVATGATGQYVWNTSGLPNFLGGVFICAVFQDAAGNANETWSKWPVIINHNPNATLPTIAVNRSVLNFGINAGTRRTSAQTVRVTVVGSGAPCWTVDNNLPSAFVVTLAGGAAQICGSGTFTVALNPANPFSGGSGSATFTVREVLPGTIENSPQSLMAFYRVHASSTAPVGTVDTPGNGASVAGSIAVTGWAVDDIDITSISVYRNAVAGEGAGPIFIGNATRVDDARPDIEAAVQSSPFNYRAGWGYLLLTNFLPGGGNGSYVLHVIATDREGRQTLLGSRSIIGTNSTSQKPFGAIDTPAQGEVITGSTSYINFGWVLARGPAIASPALSPSAVVTVVIDGVSVGAPGGWTNRADLDSLFPAATYPGISKAAGNFTFNPSSLGNGVHTIAWGVTANNGLSDGIGSRYFTVAPASGLRIDTGTTQVVAAQPSVDPGRDLGRHVRDLGPIDMAGPRLVTAGLQQRVVVDVSRTGVHRYDAYLVANDSLRPLPVGASFDRQKGILYWQPGVGYSGAYDFVVVSEDRTRVPVRVVLRDDPRRRAASRMFANLFVSSN